jgi:hypothetical protein
MITTPSHTAFDALDLLLALAVAPLHPLAAALVGVQWFLRRSPALCAWVLDLAAQGGAHILTRVGFFARPRAEAVGRRRVGRYDGQGFLARARG